jgi:hypothetical protein
MQIFPRELAPTTSPQEVQCLWHGPGDFAFQPQGILLRVIWLPEEKIKPPQEGMHPFWVNNGGNRRDVRVAEKEDFISFWQPGFSMFLDLNRREGETRLSHPLFWQNVLRVLYFFELLEVQGLLFHASGLLRHGLAYVFPGPSGAGKTTIVRLSPGLPLLSDEIVAVQMFGNGESPKAHGTPFFGDLGQPGEEVTATLKGLYFPQKDKENRLVPLSPRGALMRLLPNVCAFTTWQPRLEKLFNLSFQLAEQAPGFDLHFRPEPDFWQVLNGP